MRLVKSMVLGTVLFMTSMPHLSPEADANAVKNVAHWIISGIPFIGVYALDHYNETIQKLSPHQREWLYNFVTLGIAYAAGANGPEGTHRQGAELAGYATLAMLATELTNWEPLRNFLHMIPGVRYLLTTEEGDDHVSHATARRSILMYSGLKLAVQQVTAEKK